MVTSSPVSILLTDPWFNGYSTLSKGSRRKICCKIFLEMLLRKASLRAFFLTLCVVQAPLIYTSVGILKVRL